MNCLKHKGYEFRYIRSLEEHINVLTFIIARISKNATWHGLYFIRKTGYVLEYLIIKKRPCNSENIKPLNFLL